MKIHEIKRNATNVRRGRGTNRYSVLIAGGHGRNSPTAISSQSCPSKRDSNMTINDCKTSRGKETALFSLCARRG